MSAWEFWTAVIAFTWLGTFLYLIPAVLRRRQRHCDAEIQRERDAVEKILSEARRVTPPEGDDG